MKSAQQASALEQLLLASLSWTLLQLACSQSSVIGQITAHAQVSNWLVKGNLSGQLAHRMPLLHNWQSFALHFFFSTDPTPTQLIWDLLWHPQPLLAACRPLHENFLHPRRAQQPLTDSSLMLTMHANLAEHRLQSV